MTDTADRIADWVSTQRGGPEDLRSGRYTDAVRLLTDGLTARLS